jgi:hypothetical protein
MREVEFWPDYGGALLHEEGRRLTLETLGVPGELQAELLAWLAEYDDAKLEPATRDVAWIGRGQALFDRLREALQPAGVELIDWEGHWDRSKQGPSDG